MIQIVHKYFFIFPLGLQHPTNLNCITKGFNGHPPGSTRPNSDYCGKPINKVEGEKEFIQP